MSSFSNYNQKIIEEFRANGGTVTSHPARNSLLLLTTTGAKSGEPRTAPVFFLRDGERILVIASKGGADTNPDWYHNLLANPKATVELGADKFTVHAEIPAPEERDRLFAKVTSVAPGFGEYQTKTKRVIPVIVLHRA